MAALESEADSKIQMGASVKVSGFVSAGVIQQGEATESSGAMSPLVCTSFVLDHVMLVFVVTVIHCGQKGNLRFRIPRRSTWK